MKIDRIEETPNGLVIYSDVATCAHVNSVYRIYESDTNQKVDLLFICTQKNIVEGNVSAKFKQLNIRYNTFEKDWTGINFYVGYLLGSEIKEVRVEVE